MIAGFHTYLTGLGLWVWTCCGSGCAGLEMQQVGSSSPRPGTRFHIKDRFLLWPQVALPQFVVPVSTNTWWWSLILNQFIKNLDLRSKRFSKVEEELEGFRKPQVAFSNVVKIWMSEIFSISSSIITRHHCDVFGLLRNRSTLKWRTSWSWRRSSSSYILVRLLVQNRMGWATSLTFVAFKTKWMFSFNDHTFLFWEHLNVILVTDEEPAMPRRATGNQDSASKAVLVLLRWFLFTKYIKQWRRTYK